MSEMTTEAVVPEGVELPDPARSTETPDVAPVEEITYEGVEK